jgi:hypothetical protein
MMFSRPLVVVVFLAASSANGFAQQAGGTFADTVNAGISNTKYYGFTPSDSGQFLATLSWDDRLAEHAERTLAAIGQTRR